MLRQTAELSISDPNMQKRIRTKYNLIRELVQTEEAFSSDMHILYDVYYSQVLQPPYCDYISERDILALFTNIDQVLLLSRIFVSHSKECIPDYILKGCDLTPPVDGKGTILKDIKSNIGEVILEYLPSMEMAYTIYCAQSEFQLNTFYRLNKQSSPTIDTWLSECRKSTEKRTKAWTLDALLIKPVQRLLKYPLLLASMLEVTPEDHPDYALLKEAKDKMQQTANQINSIEPENVFVYPTLDEGLTPTFPQYQPQPIDYNTAMSQLNIYPQCDQELEILVIQFDRKQRHIKNIMKNLRGQISQIQNHFDCTNSLAHAWSSWSSFTEDSDNASSQNSQIKLHKRFAMFSLPFTTSSSANVSTNKLHKCVEKEVIRPLHDVWLAYYNAANALSLREKCHPAFQKYVEWKANNASTVQNIPPLDFITVSNADLFMKLHVKLKNELPELFGMTEDVIDRCLIRFLAIQRDWFRIAVDTTSNVFRLSLADIRADEKDGDPIIATFYENQSLEARQIIDEDLMICQFNSTLNSFDFQTVSSMHSSASSSSSGNGVVCEENRSNSSLSSMEGLPYKLQTSEKSSKSSVESASTSVFTDVSKSLHDLSGKEISQPPILQRSQPFMQHRQNNHSVVSLATINSNDQLSTFEQTDSEMEVTAYSMTSMTSVRSEASTSSHVLHKRNSLLSIRGWYKKGRRSKVKSPGNTKLDGVFPKTVASKLDMKKELTMAEL